MPPSTSIRPLTNHKEPKQFILLTTTKLWSVRNSQTEWDLPWAGRSVNLSSLCFRESRGSPAGSADPGLSPQVLLSRFPKHPGQVREIKRRVFPLLPLGRISTFAIYRLTSGEAKQLRSSTLQQFIECLLCAEHCSTYTFKPHFSRYGIPILDRC